MRAGARSDRFAGVHPRELLDALGSAERRDVGAYRIVVAALRHPEVSVGKRRDLRQMGHAHHLPAARKRLQQPPDCCGNRSNGRSPNRLTLNSTWPG